jgi:hypothetical protein
MPPARFAFAFCLLAAPGAAGEITLSYPAVERAVWATMLSQQGRYYMEGGPGDTCRYAFVQEPKVSAEAGRLAVSFLFSGRAGATVAGRCVGPGDTLRITASGAPTYEAGEIRLAGLQLTAADSAYFKLVAPVIQAALEKRLSYPLRSDLEHGLAAASAGGPFRLKLSALDVRGLRAETDRLVVSYDASLAIE